MAEVRTTPRRNVVHPNRPTASAQVTTTSKPAVEREKLVKVSSKRPLETTPGTKGVIVASTTNDISAAKKIDEKADGAE